jgi:hypothetical protein
MKRLELPGSHGAVNVVCQTEFPLRVAVCAWCKPRDRGANIGALSHGICPRHFREMKIELQIRRAGGDETLVGHRSRRTRRLGRLTGDVNQLRFPFPLVAADVSPQPPSALASAHP